MNNKLLFSTAILTAMLSGCASEDPVVNNSEDGGGEKRYLTVNFVSPAGSRAEGDYENGTAAENQADKALFLFYDENGNSTQAPQEVDLTQAWPTPTQSSTSPQVEKISTATVVIAGTKQPSQMIAILNPPADIRPQVYGYRSATVRNLRDSYDAHEAGKFIMTNSVYVKTHENGFDLGDLNYKEVFTTDITGKAQKTIEAAQLEENQVNVYVERTVAKIRTTAITEGFVSGETAEGENLVINGAAGTIPIIQEIEGIEIANAPMSTFLIKDITGWQTWDWSKLPGNNKYAWNDPVNKRCYWATTPSSLAFNNLSWNNISNSMISGAINPNFRDPEANQTFYVLANTHPTIHTSVLVTATIKKKDPTTGLAGEPVDFVRWGGAYYLVGNEPRINGSLNPDYNGFLNQYASIIFGHGYRVEYKEGNEVKYRPIAATEISWITEEEHKGYMEGADKFEAYETTAKVEAANIPNLTDPNNLTKIVKMNAEGTFEQSNVNAINTDLRKKENRVWMWKGGKCYYYVDINHFGPNNNLSKEEEKVAVTDFSKGVIRNHIYDLTLKSLKGFGTPVFNPDIVIIPQKPSDDLWYLAAKLNILKWRVVKQEVNFE